MGKRKLILLGGGGHCTSCIDVIEQEGKYKIFGILDLASQVGNKVMNYEIIGVDADIENFITEGFSFFVTIGQLKSAALRKKLFLRLINLNASIATIISPLAYVSKYSELGMGTVVMHGVTINAGTNIGNNVILNTGCDIEHNSVIGDHCHISTHAVINGDCIIGTEVFIGSNATIINGVSVAGCVVIGAGAVINRNIEGSGIYAGIPAKKIG